MSDTRFNWRGASEYDAARELKRRADENPKCKRTLMPRELQKKLKCLVGCKRMIRADEIVYASTPNPGVSDGGRAHVECLESYLASVKSTTQKEVKLAEAKKLEAKGVLTVPSSIDLEAQFEELIQAARKEGYQRGFDAGQQAAVTKLAQLAAKLRENEELTH